MSKKNELDPDRKNVVVSGGKFCLSTKNAPSWAFRKKKEIVVDGVSFAVWAVPSLRKASLERLIEENMNSFKFWASEASPHLQPTVQKGQ